MSYVVRLAVAHALCRGLAAMYRVHPSDRLYRAYVRAIRRANAIYWAAQEESE